MTKYLCPLDGEMIIFRGHRSRQVDRMSGSAWDGLLSGVVWFVAASTKQGWWVCRSCPHRSEPWTYQASGKVPWVSRLSIGSGTLGESAGLVLTGLRSIRVAYGGAQMVLDVGEVASLLKWLDLLDLMDLMGQPISTLLGRAARRIGPKTGSSSIGRLKATACQQNILQRRYGAGQFGVSWSCPCPPPSSEPA